MRLFKRKLIAIILFCAVLTSTVIPAFATDATRRNNAISNDVLTAIQNQLQFVYAQRSQFGLEAASNFSVGLPIQAYEYVDGVFQDMDFDFYPLFSGNVLYALMLVKVTDNGTVAQLCTEDISVLTGRTDAVAFVYDKTSRYLYTSGTFIELGDFSAVDGIVSYRDELNLQASVEGIVVNSLSSYRAINTPIQTRALVGVNVSYVDQEHPDYEDWLSPICWAACVASIGNYLTGLNLTAYAVSQHVNDLSATTYEAIVYLNSLYGASYVYYASLTETAIEGNLMNGYPVYGSFVTGYSSASGHAVVISEIDRSIGYMTLMNPSVGFVSAYKDGSVYKYTTGAGVTYTLSDGGARY